MLFELGAGNEQERIVSCMLAGYLFVFLPTLLRRLRRDQVASLYHRFSNADLVAELKAVSEHLKLTSRLDGLTGIANRAHLDYCLERAWRRCHRARAPLSLVLVDVDYFKQFNDLYGHQLGTSACSRWRACWPKCSGAGTISPPATAGRSSPCCCPVPACRGAADRRERAGGAEGFEHSPSEIPGVRPGQLQLRGGDPGAGSEPLHQ